MSQLVLIKCSAPDAVEVLAGHVDEMVKILRHRRYVVVEVTREKVKALGRWRRLRQ